MLIFMTKQKVHGQINLRLWVDSTKGQIIKRT